MATTKNEIRLSVGKALTALQAIDRMPALRGKTGYWIGRIGSHLEPIQKQFVKQRTLLQKELSGGARDKDGNYDIPKVKLAELEERLEALMDVEEVIPFGPVRYDEILAEFKDMKDDEGRPKVFEIHPNTMRHLAGVIIVMDDDKPVRDRTAAKPEAKAK